MILLLHQLILSLQNLFTMNKTKLLSILVGLLVLLNVITLCFLLIGMQRNHHNPEEGRKSIMNRFSFNGNQIKLFEISKTKHMKQSKSLSMELKDASLAYYNYSAVNEIKDSLYSNIESITQKIYKANQNHFDDVRRICNPAQLPEMDFFIKGLINRKRPQPGKRR